MKFSNNFICNFNIYLEQLLTSKACPLFKATLPCYFVAICSTLVDVESYGWIHMNLDQMDKSSSSFNLKYETSPYRNEKIISSSQYSKKIKKAGNENEENNLHNQTSIEKRINFMTNYLKNAFFTLSLNQSNLDGLISIYELIK